MGYRDGGRWRLREWFKALAALLFGLMLAEATLWVAFATTDLSTRVAYRLGPDGARVGWLYARRVRGPDNVFVADPDVGWVARPGVFTGPDWAATVVEGGVRAPGPTSTARTPGRPRVVALGDSFGFGWDQSDDQTWQAELLRRRPELEIANLSVCGHDTGQALLRYRRDGRAWQPDVVLLAYNKLLLGRTVEPFTMYQRPILRGELGVFEPEGGPIPDQEALEAELWWRPRLVYVLGMARYAWWGGQDEHWGLAERRSQALLDRFVEEVRADGRVPLVAWFATPDEVREAAAGRARDIRCPRDPSVRCVDLTDTLLAVHASAQPVERGTHWSEPAAAAAAAALDEVLWELIPAAGGAD